MWLNQEHGASNLSTYGASNLSTYDWRTDSDILSNKSMPAWIYIKTIENIIDSFRVCHLEQSIRNSCKYFILNWNTYFYICFDLSTEEHSWTKNFLILISELYLRLKLSFQNYFLEILKFWLVRMSELPLNELQHQHKIIFSFITLMFHH